MKILVFFAIFLLAVFQAGFAEGQKEQPSTTMSSENSMSNGNSMTPKNSMSSEDSMTSESSMTGPTMEGANAMSAPASKGFFDTTGLAPYVVSYTTEAAAQALAAKGPTVYFFAASWCPICNAAMKDIRVHYRDLTTGATLVLVNYDTATALKTRYGVTSQHTFIQIDPTGKPIAVWSGTETVALIDSHLVTK
jgi:hypothetical protein